MLQSRKTSSTRLWLLEQNWKETDIPVTNLEYKISNKNWGRSGLWHEVAHTHKKEDILFDKYHG